ncbi:MAG: protoporphyrinogen oxidase [Halieaceae bacterium]|nr:protoporphyrinogen oxidase [Halieaceae bacterium]
MNVAQQSGPRGDAPPVVIVGAGITGLTTAWSLRQRGIEVRVLEASSRVGGAIHTIREGDWRVETGPNTVLLKDQRVRRFVEDDVGLSEQFLFANSAASRRYVVRDGIPRALPLGPGSFLSTPLFSWRAKLRLLREPFIPRRDVALGEEAIGDFVQRRLGPEFLDYAINPFIAGVYAGNPAHLSVEAAFPKLAELEQRYGSLIRGTVAGARERRAAGRENPDKARIFTFRDGLDTLPRALASGLGPDLVTDTAVSSLQRRGTVWEITTAAGDVVEASRVMVAGGAAALDSIDGPWEKSLGAEIEQPPVSVVSLGFAPGALRHPLDGFGLLVPEVEKRRILGSLFPTSLFPDRAPDGHALLTNFVGGTRQPQYARLDDESLVKLVTEEIDALLGVRDGPVFTRIDRWERAIPQYNLGYGEISAAMDRIEASQPGLYLAGNYRGAGISVGDCILHGLDLADRIAGTADDPTRLGVREVTEGVS